MVEPSPLTYPFTPTFIYRRNRIWSPLVLMLGAVLKSTLRLSRNQHSAQQHELEESSRCLISPSVRCGIHFVRLNTNTAPP